MVPGVMDGGGGCLLNADGSIVVMSANFSHDRPITTTCNLWVLRQDETSGDFPLAIDHTHSTLEQLTVGKDIVEFGWVSGRKDTLWATWVVDGVYCETGLLSVHTRATTPTWTLLPSTYKSHRCRCVVSLWTDSRSSDDASTTDCPVPKADVQSLLFVSESATVYPQLVSIANNDEPTVVPLPHRDELLDVFNELRYCGVTWVM